MSVSVVASVRRGLCSSSRYSTDRDATQREANKNKKQLKSRQALFFFLSLSFNILVPFCLSYLHVTLRESISVFNFIYFVPLCCAIPSVCLSRRHPVRFVCIASELCGFSLLSGSHANTSSFVLLMRVPASLLSLHLLLC